MNKVDRLPADEIGGIIGARCLELLNKSPTSLPSQAKSQFIDFVRCSPFDVQAPHKSRLPPLFESDSLVLIAGGAPADYGHSSKTSFRRQGT